MKKIVALALALVLVMSLAVAAFAIYKPVDDGTTRRANREADRIVLNGPEEENPTTGAPVFAAPVAIAVLAGAAYVISKRK